MVRGFDSFRAWFRGYEDNYVIIGGTACDLLMGAAGDEFRATKDIDIVIISEALNKDFGKQLWEYIKFADYQKRLKSNGAPIYYRFSNPMSSEFPAMIELFSRRLDNIFLPPDAVLTPLPIDDEISSLSAILLDDEYYNFMQTGIINSHDVPILDVSHIIPFKAKAWIELSTKRAQGFPVDSKHIRKHKNDILRLSGLLSSEMKIPLPDKVMADMQFFFSNVDEPERFLRVSEAFMAESGK